MKKIKFPTAQTILIIIAGLVAILTWLVPSGKYDSLSYNKNENTFTTINLSETKVLPATQETLDLLEIKIPLNKFETKNHTWMSLHYLAFSLILIRMSF